MFRVRQLFSHPRLFFRISPPASLNSSTRNVRHVQFKRPRIRSFITKCCLYGMAFHLSSSFVLSQFDNGTRTADALEEPVAAGRDKDKHDPDEKTDLDPVFIPLGLPYLREGEFYAVSDPEWKQFVKFSQDREKLNSLQGELASLVLSDAAQSAILSRLLGGPLELTGSWLVHHFPSRAPPKYTRIGIQITDTAIALVSKYMAFEEGDRLKRCIWPLPATLAIKDAYSVLFQRQLSKLSATNLDEEHQSSSSNLPSYTTMLSSDPKAADDSSQVPQHHSRISNAGESANRSNDDYHDYPFSVISTLKKLLLQFGPGSDLYTASLAFKFRFNDCLSRERHASPRGVFYFAGPVGLKGPKGFCRIEVKGEYDPAAAKWAIVSMQLKDLSVFNQSALGGH
ncbi:hypothetical protein P168DRAFT_301935 [Aspergillus campestris IBT 28561]|uniref:Uncharacterized protein n=1 Tax=Aspergillus campestris (strain IBT 28561) TaxID=1392248 RepID=A0A2I1DAL8_ASPC2|nr:uncharacterized protein P168DRAFT_301935 [Aspergillus campestris IBT 28561]PKY06910.1 hypothetical protein P168DRAFT_301935 [Aspergillus campestris IBT 28561]